eukprot:7376951-Prymnesium_polylepis.1
MAVVRLYLRATLQSPVHETCSAGPRRSPAVSKSNQSAVRMCSRRWSMACAVTAVRVSRGVV